MLHALTGRQRYHPNTRFFLPATAKSKRLLSIKKAFLLWGSNQRTNNTYCTVKCNCWPIKIPTTYIGRIIPKRTRHTYFFMAFVLGVGSYLKTNAQFIDLDYQYFLGFLQIQHGNSSPEGQHTSSFILHASWSKVQNMGTADPLIIGIPMMGI